MFARWKRPKQVPTLTLLDEAGGAVASLPMAHLCLPEAVVLSLSRQYFNDPEPCHIHRGAILQRALSEIALACPQDVLHPIDALPADVRRYFDAYPQAHSVRITLETL